MKKMMKAVGRFMYCTWYGAAVVFVAVAAVLCGLQFATCCMGDLVPWPKDVHLLIMFATVANIGVAMIVSLCRRKWGRAIGLLVLCVAANYAEACEAESGKDFVHKLKVSMKELSETRIWLKLIGESGYVEKTKLADLITESQEISRIFGASVSTARKRICKQ